jgi:histidinol-phosphate phosphatase family protein
MTNCLIVIDRDGTIIENHKYLGKNNNWKSKIKLIDKTIFLLKALDILFPDNVKIVFTNQTGVALGYFNEERVKQVNNFVKFLLRMKGIIIEHWIFSPEADKFYADQKEIKNKYVKTKSSRKPNPKLLEKQLIFLKKPINTFKRKIVIGDSEDDKELASNIDAYYIDCQ